MQLLSVGYLLHCQKAEGHISRGRMHSIRHTQTLSHTQKFPRRPLWFILAVQCSNRIIGMWLHAFLLSSWKWKKWKSWHLPSMVTHTRNWCSAFNPSKCTHTAVRSEHTVNTHPEQWAAISSTWGATGGSVPCSRALQPWVLRVEESAVHSFPTHLQLLPAPRLKPVTFWLQVQFSNHYATAAPFSKWFEQILCNDLKPTWSHDINVPGCNFQRDAIYIPISTYHCSFQNKWTLEAVKPHNHTH